MEPFTVVTHVVAVEQRQRPCVIGHTRFQNAGNDAVNRFTAAVEIARQIGVIHFQLVAGVQVVAPFRHGKSNHFGLRSGAFGNQRLQIRLPRQQFLNRRDLFVLTFALRADRFQHITTVLRRQRLHNVLGVIANIAGGNVPARIAGSDQTMQIPRLMGAVKRT